MVSSDIFSSDSISCRFSKTVGYDKKTMHIHDVYEIFMPLCEDVRFFVNDRMELLDRGDVILFTGNDLHKASVPPQAVYERCVITFPVDRLLHQFGEGRRLLSCFRDPERRHLSLSEEDQSVFLMLARALDRECCRSDPSDLGQWLTLGQILLLLCRAARMNPPEPAEESPSSYTREILQYIDANFRDPISLDLLSSRFFLNKSYLCRLFKRETGFHIHDYMIYRRLSHAMVLLREGKSIGDTAKLSGFGSDTFFITVFRKYLGTTPYQYAKNHREPR